MLRYIGPVGSKYSILLAIWFALLSSCNSEPKGGTLCDRTFQPYMDFVSGQARTNRNGEYVDAMGLYSAGEYAQAVDGLKRYLAHRDAAKGAWLYLACSQLAIGRPFDAELSLDRLENSNEKGFTDQCEWYTVLCWLCSDQRARALSGARAIAAKQQHTYKAQAEQLVEELSKEPAP